MTLRGSNFLLKMGNGASAETFTTIGGLRPTSLQINGEAVDVTHKGSNGWRELLPGGGIRSVSLSAGGVWLGGDSDQEALQAAALAGTFKNFQIDDGEQVLEGTFQITQFGRSGEHNNEVSFTITLESTGEVTIV